MKIVKGTKDIKLNLYRKNDRLSDSEYEVYVSKRGEIMTRLRLKSGEWTRLKKRSLFKGKRYYTIRIKDDCNIISRLVMECWGHVPTDFYNYRKYEVHHINGNGFDNRIENLIVVPKILHKTLHSLKGAKRLDYTRKVKVPLDMIYTEFSDEERSKILNDVQKMHAHDQNFEIAFACNYDYKKLYLMKDRKVYEIIA